MRSNYSNKLIINNKLETTIEAFEIPIIIFNFRIHEVLVITDSWPKLMKQAIKKLAK